MPWIVDNKIFKLTDEINKWFINLQKEFGIDNVKIISINTITLGSLWIEVWYQKLIK